MNNSTIKYNHWKLSDFCAYVIDGDIPDWSYKIVDNTVTLTHKNGYVIKVTGTKKLPSWCPDLVSTVTTISVSHPQLRNGRVIISSIEAHLGKIIHYINNKKPITKFTGCETIPATPVDFKPFVIPNFK